MFAKCLAFVLLLGLVPASGLAETGYDMWLRYAALDQAAADSYRNTVPSALVMLGDDSPVTSARDELLRGIRGMLGRTLRLESSVAASSIVLGTLADIRNTVPGLAPEGDLPPDGFRIQTVQLNGTSHTVITGSNARGVLYGTFAYLRKIALGESLSGLDVTEAPYSPIRWVNHWDNINGTIERGYGGRSLFWDGDHVHEDLGRVTDYARMLASLGINGASISNVNANPRVIESDMLGEVARVAAAFRPWGVRIAVSVDFGSPMRIGGLDTFDPLDPDVIAWWQAKIDELYVAVPDLGGIVLKADSEGRVGPSTYGRTHADATNVIARALQPYDGTIFYRGFVYDNQMDWRDPANDRARAAWDNFIDLDGEFEPNAIIQIKNGPIDFQVREPASPLFGALRETGEAIELQITQEYFGQARHTVFLVPMWKEVLDFDMRVDGGNTPVKAVVTGKVFPPIGGLVGVSNAGLDTNWYGNQMSQANLYGFGRLAWNPDLTSREIAEEWTRQTFGHDPEVVRTVMDINLTSWRTFENYTGPLGLQTLTDITGNHYGVNVEASEFNGWGQWHKADPEGVGFDRSVATGTGFSGQFHPEVARIYESIETTPDELLLFLHHVPYTQVLKSGKTVIQHLYDTHYEGADAVAGYVRAWKTLAGRVDDQRYDEILAQLDYQAGQAEVWRDAVARYFHRMSGIEDEQGRVGTYPNRTEAELMNLDGYVGIEIDPWEGASGEGGVECSTAICTAEFEYDGPAGWRDIVVRYFDHSGGTASFQVRVGGQLVDEWTGIDLVPTRRPDSSSSSRRVISGIALRSGDDIQITGIPEGTENASLDYVEIREPQNE
jgi:alpha-glucuronidase